MAGTLPKVYIYGIVCTMQVTEGARDLLSPHDSAICTQVRHFSARQMSPSSRETLTLFTTVFLYPFENQGTLVLTRNLPRA